METEEAQMQHFITFLFAEELSCKSDSVYSNCNPPVSRSSMVTDKSGLRLDNSRQLQWPRKCPFLVFLLEHGGWWVTGEWESTKKDGSLTDYWSLLALLLPATNCQPISAPTNHLRLCRHFTGYLSFVPSNLLERLLVGNSRLKL